MELSTLQVTPRVGLPEPLRQRVQATIDRLDLNDDEFIQARAGHYEAFQSGDVQFRHVQKHFPFLAKELIRQGLVPEGA